MAYVHGYILVFFIVAMPIYGSSMAGLNDANSIDTEANSNGHDYHAQVYAYQEYYARLQTSWCV